MPVWLQQESARVVRFSDKFCQDSRLYRVLFVCFIVSNILLIYTLYTGQPERYRRISRWFSTASNATSGRPDAQVAAFVAPGTGQSSNWMPDAVYLPQKTVVFGEMTLGDAGSNAWRKRGPGTTRYGVEVLSISKSSIAYLSGIRKGDVIVSVDRMPTYTLTDFGEVVRNLDPSQGILFDVNRKGRFYYLSMETWNAGRQQEKIDGVERFTLTKLSGL